MRITTSAKHIDETETTRIRRATARLAAAAAVSSTGLVLAAEAAHAGVQLNHNEVTGADRGRVRRAALRLAVTTAVSSTAIVLAAEVAHARIAVNHNEVAGLDQR